LGVRKECFWGEMNRVVSTNALREGRKKAMEKKKKYVLWTKEGFDCPLEKWKKEERDRLVQGPQKKKKEPSAAPKEKGGGSRPEKVGRPDGPLLGKKKKRPTNDTGNR